MCINKFCVLIYCASFHRLLSGVKAAEEEDESLPELGNKQVCTMVELLETYFLATFKLLQPYGFFLR